MSISNKSLKLYKYGFTKQKKKAGVNYWRFFLNAMEQTSAIEQMFYIEFEMLNPSVSPEEVQLGFKPRITLTADDLQYALAGTKSAQTLETEMLVQPSYCCVRIGTLGENAKTLCSYDSIKKIEINTKPFEIVTNNCFFSINKLTGSIGVDKKTATDHPELFTDAGSASWNISYDIIKDCPKGYSVSGTRWFPMGYQTKMTGKIKFNGLEYIINPKNSYAYTDRYWGKSLPEPWLHISASDLISKITGKPLFDSAFAIQGTFDGSVSFIGSFEGFDIQYISNSNGRGNSVVWDCSQMPDEEDIQNNKLHWSVSINYKNWIVDIDVYSKIKDLCNRTLELPEGDRNILSMLSGGNGVGEIKLYKKNKKTIEQIEHAELRKVVCEFGHKETSEL